MTDMKAVLEHYNDVLKMNDKELEEHFASCDTCNHHDIDDRAEQDDNQQKYEQGEKQ